jgi:O-antigen/teichoic acid export membrane protein
MAVSLYTSRVVLATLGVDDFGLNAVVTSAITIFSFINGSMSSATSRFLTFELGRGDFERLKKTFSCALNVHILIALLILLLGETIGLWYLENKMVIPLDRMTAARWVYQLTIVSSMLTITQVPYNASIMSHEKMNVYAYIEILNTCLKLGIVYLLVIGNFDKLILYAVLTLCVSVAITLIYRIYCIRHFEECKYKFIWDKSIFRPMLSFSGWDLFGNASFSLKTSGIAVILNLFFQLSVNVAYSIANQVQSAISLLGSNIIKAATPQLTKYYSVKKYDEMTELINTTTFVSSILMLFFAIPMMFETNFVLRLWLKDVPIETNLFVKWGILSSFIYTFSSSMNMATNSTGKIKTKTIRLCIVSVIMIICSYLIFKIKIAESYWAIILICISNLYMFVMLLVECKKNIPTFSIFLYLKKTCLIEIKVILLSIILPFLFVYLFEEGFLRFMLIFFSSLLSIGLSTYWIVLDKAQRQVFKRYLYSKIIKS